MSCPLTKPLDRLSHELLVRLTAVTTARDLPFVVVGALARDIVFEHIHGVPVRRATTDVDVLVRVADWPTHRRLCATILAMPEFQADPRGVEHRYLFRQRLPLDVLPAGPIATDGVIAWPSRGEPRMSVLDWDELVRLAVAVRLDATTTVLVATPAGLAALKLLAWADRPHRLHDLEDLHFTMTHYLDTIPEERLHSGDATDLLTDDFDYDAASARLLGRDLAQLTGASTRTVLVRILAALTDPVVWLPARLENDMSDPDRTAATATRLIGAMAESLTGKPE